ncbi:MAG: hypothetical protein R2746_09745 [Acidimicrobiales bacterium]
MVLTDEVAPDDGASEGSSAAPMGDGDQVGYELAGWGNQLKVSLEGMLDKAGIARAWRPAPSWWRRPTRRRSTS